MVIDRSGHKIVYNELTSQIVESVYGLNGFLFLDYMFEASFNSNITELVGSLPLYCTFNSCTSHGFDCVWVNGNMFTLDTSIRLGRVYCCRTFIS